MKERTRFWLRALFLGKVGVVPYSRRLPKPEPGRRCVTAILSGEEVLADIPEEAEWMHLSKDGISFTDADGAPIVA